MSLEQYDNAVLSRIMGLFDNVVLASPDEAFKYSAQNPDHPGKVVLPLISVWRTPDFTISRVMFNDSRMRRGIGARSTVSNLDTDPIQQVRSVPVELRYQIDIFSDRRDNCDGICTDLLVYLFQNPCITITIPESNTTHDFYLKVSDSISDNTSIGEFEDSGRMFRLTIELTIDEAIIWSVDRTGTNPVQKSTIDIKDFDSKSLETVIVE